MKHLLFLMCVLVPVTLLAQWSNNPAVNTPISDTTRVGSYLNPKSISDGAGGAFIVWSSNNSLIRGQRVNLAGQRLWSTGGIEVGSARDPVYLSALVYPVIVSDDSGGAIIAYAEFNARRIIGASRFRPDGSRVWDRILCFSATGTRNNPAICRDGNGGAFITWEDTRNGSSNMDIFVQHISRDGTISWDSSGVAACTATQNQSVPRIASDGMGGAFITWADNRILDSDIYAQRVNSQGQTQWGVNGMRVCVMSNNPAGEPRIVATGVGTAIIAWIDGRSGGTWDLYAQEVNPDTVSWATNGVAVATGVRNQWKAEMIADGSGGAIIAWQDNRRVSFNEADVYAQRISSNGVALWTANGISVCTQPGNANPLLNISSDGDGGAFIVWQDIRNGNTDLYAQRVHRGGTTMWSHNGVAVSTAPSSQVTQTVCHDGNRGAVIVWADARHGSYLYIYGQGVDSTGALGGTTSVKEEAMPASFRLEQNYPNPFNPSTTIRFTIPEVRGQRSEVSRVSLKVYDVLGREVATLVNEPREPGVYSVNWDATGFASGVYIYRLTSDGLSLTKKLLLTK